MLHTHDDGDDTKGHNNTAVTRRIVKTPRDIASTFPCAAAHDQARASLLTQQCDLFFLNR